MMDDVARPTPIPMAQVCGARWWDVINIHGGRFRRSFAERVPDGHFLALAIEAVPMDVRAQHAKVLARKRQTDPGLMLKAAVCGVVNFGGNISVMFGHATEVEAG